MFTFVSLLVFVLLTLVTKISLVRSPVASSLGLQARAWAGILTIVVASAIIALLRSKGGIALDILAGAYLGIELARRLLVPSRLLDVVISVLSGRLPGTKDGSNLDEVVESEVGRASLVCPGPARPVLEEPTLRSEPDVCAGTRVVPVFAARIETTDVRAVTSSAPPSVSPDTMSSIPPVSSGDPSVAVSGTMSIPASPQVPRISTEDVEAFTPRRERSS